MKVLIGKESESAMHFIDIAADVALGSGCLRSRCGSIIVNDNEIIGRGFNSLPMNKVLEHCIKDELPIDFKSDRTCCVHAEQRAVMNALATNPKKVEGSTLYFIRLDKEGNKLNAEDPYCTICSKMALDVGISEFVLLREEGITVYDIEEYNRFSFGFRTLL